MFPPFHFLFNFYISKNPLLVPAEVAFLQSGGTKRRLQGWKGSGRRGDGFFQGSYGECDRSW